MPKKQELTVNGRKVPVTNLDKVLYPAAHFTKGQVIDYYVRAADFILPHLRDRPVTLKRFQTVCAPSSSTRKTRRNSLPIGFGPFLFLAGIATGTSITS